MARYREHSVRASSRASSSAIFWRMRASAAAFAPYAHAYPHRMSGWHRALIINCSANFINMWPLRLFSPHIIDVLAFLAMPRSRHRMFSVACSHNASHRILSHKCAALYIFIISAALSFLYLLSCLASIWLIVAASNGNKHNVSHRHSRSY